jgi:sugar phosphate isomerase/epimerase
MSKVPRRHFVSTLLGAGAASLTRGQGAPAAKAAHLQFGLVTYMWGADLDLPSLIATLEKAKIHGVELRVDHAHGVSPALSAAERAEVRKRFESSPVEAVGLGTNWEFHSPNAGEVKKNLEGAKEYVRLSHDIGASGVKVKPNALPKDVEKAKTLDQIARALAELGDHALGFGQEIRLEVHGGVSDLGDIATIMKTAARDNVRVCWNSNQQDLDGDGIEANFAKVKPFLGRVLHIRGARVPGYPWATLAKLLVDDDYEGWVMLEAGGKRPEGDPAAILGDQRDAFMELVEEARKAA